MNTLCYINQNDYEHLPYPSDLGAPESPLHEGTVAQAGGGLCCICMMVGALCGESPSVEQVAALAAEHQANLQPGTDMSVLAPVVAEKYGLLLQTSDDVNEAKACLQAGGLVIVDVGGAQQGESSVFFQQGHYLLLAHAWKDRVCLYDPARTEKKYKKALREGKIRFCHECVCGTEQLLDDEIKDCSPRYYLFVKK